MGLLKKQVGYVNTMEHKTTLFSAFIWWAINKNKHCRSFCPACEWYLRCQEDVAFEEMEDDI